jgi:lipopolysaccharide/colanic/teichoic acid biosynthesis glycosyltransferase
MQPGVKAAMAHGSTTAPAVVLRGGIWMAVKRAMDVVGAALLLIVLSPVFLVLAVAIVIDTGRPVFFRQVRLGRGLREFRVLKFRTMKTDSTPDMHMDYIAKLATGQADDDSLKKLTADPRVTAVGRFLRRTSLDELPQLVNVFLGHMSLVGPRPALEYELQHYQEHHFERFAVKPGMTGLWQVSGRNTVGFTEMLDLDAEYARSSNLLTDLKILVKTPAAAVSGAA